MNVTRSPVRLLLALLALVGSFLVLHACTQQRASVAPRAPAGASTEFSYPSPDAASVYLAGSFNAWAHNVGGKPVGTDALMHRSGDGVWRMSVPNLAGVVRYKFVVEGPVGRFNWLADPSVTEHDRDGNSVRVVGLSPWAAGGDVSSRPLIELHARPDSGTLTALLRDPAHAGAFHDAVELPLFTIDGTPPREWRAASTAGTFESSAATLHIEPLGPRAVAINWRARDGKEHELEAFVADNSAYYGGGERFNAINQKGVVLSMASLDRPEDKGTCSYKPVPFIISSRGYGVWLDSTRPSTFDLNATERERIRVRERADHLRLVLIAGPTPQEVLSEFTRLTGRPSPPPAWAFAPWKSRDVHFSRDEVIADAELNRKNHLPASVIVLDSPWETSYNDFHLNERQFERPAEMFSRIRALGFVPCLWLTPFINQSNVTDMQGIDAGPSSNFRDAAGKHYLVRNQDGSPMIIPWWKGAGGLVDFTNPDATRWWHEQLSATLQWGVAAIKCDDGESNFVSDARFSDGSTAADMKGRYAQLYLKAAHDFLEAHRPGDNTLISRCGFTGTGQYPFGWAGDNQANYSFDNGLPGVILAAQNAAMSGLPFWGCDIAGYIGNATPELFIRWSQFAALTPLMMVHMQSNKGPWDFGPEALDIYRAFARLHTSLYPYLDAAAHQACEEGVPIIRPMALAFPGDAVAGQERYQYMLGPDLLVAPMYQGGTRRAVYLPDGKWIDYWTGAALSGPGRIDVDAPLEKLPLFVRAGAVIPLLPPDVDTLVQRTPEIDPSVVTLDDRRLIEVWGGDNAGSFHSSDGLTAVTHSERGDHHLTVASGTPSPRRVIVRLRFVNTRVQRAGNGSDDLSRMDGADTVVDLPGLTGVCELNWRDNR